MPTAEDPGYDPTVDTGRTALLIMDVQPEIVARLGVVLSTLHEAADLDFDLTILSDGGDGDAEVHRVLCEKVFPRQATVTTVAEWTDSLD